MSDARALLGKIRDLRQRLAQVQGLVGEANRAAASLASGGDLESESSIDGRLPEGADRQALLNASVRQLSNESSGEEIRPTRLIEKVRVQLERGRELIGRLKTLADEKILAEGDPSLDNDDTLLRAYRDTASMTESTLRLVQAFPDSPTSQMRLSEGLESIVDAISDRVSALVDAIEFFKGEFARRDALAAMLEQLNAGNTIEVVDLVALADYLLSEAKQSAPVRFLHAPPNKPAAFIAAHSITCARILARIVRHDPDWQRCIHDAIVAALLKDVGMLSVAPEVLAYNGMLEADHKHAVQSHCRIGADLVAKHLPATATLCEAIASHHERLDGTGYPAGLRAAQIGPLPRLLAVADVYSAMCCPRAQRNSFDPRSALTETLMMAERGLLDRNMTDRLMQLSFYPSGSVVELADGSVGVVVAAHTAPRELYTPAKPVVALLADARGQVYSNPRHVDLAECEGRSIVRTLSDSQRRLLLGRRYPELV